MNTLPLPNTLHDVGPRTPGQVDVTTQFVSPAELLPWLPCTVSLDIPLQRFTIGDLANLGKGSIVTTAYARNNDVPLYVNSQLIGWAELEVIDERLAVRITEVA